MKRSPIKPKRATPRRDEGRVVQARIKPKAKAAPDADEKAHMDRVARMGCLVCGKPAELHHSMSAPGKIRRRDHRFVVPLCEVHHRGRVGDHGLGSERAFLAEYGIDLGLVALMLWETKMPPTRANHR